MWQHLPFAPPCTVSDNSVMVVIYTSIIFAGRIQSYDYIKHCGFPASNFFSPVAVKFCGVSRTVTMLG